MTSIFMPLAITLAMSTSSSLAAAEVGAEAEKCLAISKSIVDHQFNEHEKAALIAQKIKYRIVEMDGNTSMVTMEVNPARLNIKLNANVVTAAYCG